MIKIDYLIKILNGNINLIDSINVRDEEIPPEIRVTVTPKHVKKMLKMFLKGEINSFDLTKWAEFICLRFEYKSVPNDIPVTSNKYDEIADYYEDMMYVIQKLSTPEIDGEINETTVRQYLRELDKYNNDKYAGLFKE